MYSLVSIFTIVFLTLALNIQVKYPESTYHQTSKQTPILIKLTLISLPKASNVFEMVLAGSVVVASIKQKLSKV